MHALPEQPAALIHLRDYRAPAWRVETVELDFDLGIEATELSARLLLRRDASQHLALRLDGENLQLLSIALDGVQLPATAYRYDGSVLEIDGAHDGSVLETRVRLRPEANTALEGLYLSGSREAGFLLTSAKPRVFATSRSFPTDPTCSRATA
jgi:aminopeptidase N